MNINGVNYHIELHGDASQTLVMLHGFTGSSRSWDEVMPHLAAQYRLITIDLLGHGKTDNPPNPERYQMEYASRDIVSILDTLVPDTQVSLFGYSMGGRLALYTAYQYPTYFNRLILESASAGLDNLVERRNRQEQDNALAQRILQHGIESFVQEWERLPLWHSQAQLPESIKHQQRLQRLANNPLGLANSLIGMGTGVQPSLWAKLPLLNLPVYLLVGEYDTKFIQLGYEMLLRLPNASLYVIPQAGHTTHLEQPELFCSWLERFMR